MEKSENKQINTIGQDFTIFSLLKFALPSVLTNICTQIFRSLDDGLFVSRYVGATALAAIKLLVPVNCLNFAIICLYSVGASTLSAHRMGEGSQLNAKRMFTRMCISCLIVSSVMAVFYNLFTDPVLHFLGATEDLMDNARIYIRICYTTFPLTALGNVLSTYYSTAGKPQMGLVSSILNGAVNIILDIVFIPVMQLGVVGSSLSTMFGDVAVVLLGIVFYANPKHEISFVKPGGELVSSTITCWKAGFSQFVNSLAFSVTTYATNIILIKLVSSDGIAANAVIGDLRTILNAAFIGYASCVAPVIAYNFGEKNPVRLKKILSYNVKIWFVGTLIITVIGQLIKGPMISLFIEDPSTSSIYEMTYEGLTIEFFAVMFTAGCILIMRMFTALGAVKTCSIFTTLRNTVIRLICIIVLPEFFGLTGVWLSFPIAEFLSFFVGLYMVYINRDNYGYGKSGKALKMM